MQLKVRKVGNSLGVILPREVVARLKVVEGDNLNLTEGPEDYRLSAYDPEIARAGRGRGEDHAALSQHACASWRSECRVDRLRDGL